MVVGASENVQVVVRVRPLTGKERDRGEDELVACVGDRTLQGVIRFWIRNSREAGHRQRLRISSIARLARNALRYFFDEHAHGARQGLDREQKNFMKLD
eukprot:1428586-Rhodomonas_salina.2